MQIVRTVVSQALDERKKLSIPVRQPLRELKVKNEELKSKVELLELIRDEVNVKSVSFDEKIEKDVELDTNITPELKGEGNLRELTRALQDMRKEMNLRPDQKVELLFSGTPDVKRFIDKFDKEIKKIVNVSLIKESINDGEEFKIGDLLLRTSLLI